MPFWKLKYGFLLLVFVFGCRSDPGYYKHEKYVNRLRKSHAKSAEVFCPVDNGMTNYPAMSIMDSCNDWYRLICAVWSDGRVIWSKNKKWGGAPFYTANISTQLIEQTLFRLNKEGILDEPYNCSCGPLVDVCAHVICLIYGEKVMYMMEDYFEEDKYTTDLERQKLKAWDMSYEAIQGLIPAEGIETNYLYEVVGRRYCMAIPPGKIEGVVRPEAFFNDADSVRWEPSHLMEDQDWHTSRIKKPVVPKNSSEGK